MRKSAIIVLMVCMSMMIWTTGCTDKKKAVAADTTDITDTIADTTAVDSLEDLIDDAPI